jgi:hypothetical protein
VVIIFVGLARRALLERRRLVHWRPRAWRKIGSGCLDDENTNITWCPSETHRSCDHRKHIQIRIHVYMLITSTTSTTSTPSTTSTTNDELADHMKRHNSYISNLIDTHGRRWPDRWVMQVKSWIDHIHRHPHQTISFNRILIKAASIFIFG